MLLLCATAISSCVENDIPYPYIELYITNVEGDGFTVRRINNSERTVYLTLDETTDIENVNITNVEYTDGAKISRDLEGVFDLTNPVKSTLYLYQSYEWQIVGEQNIEYNFNVTGQIGAERIDKDLLKVEVDVNKNTVDLSQLEITSLKLGADGITTYSPSLEELAQRDFSNIVRVTVTSHERSNIWSIYVNPITASVNLTANAWGTVAWLSATGDTSDPSLCYFEYRESGDTDWIRVESESISNGLFEACVTGLVPESDYEFIAYSNSTASSISAQTTESTPQLPNSDFEEWQTISKTIYPYAVGTDEYWGSGNPGSITGGLNITQPDESEISPYTTGKIAASLSGNSIFKFLAAGNIFTGSFYGTSGGTYGTIKMGRPFTQRPLRLEGYAKYNCGKVTNVNNKWGDYKLNLDDDDEGIIYVALGTWSKEEYGYNGSGVLCGTDESPVIADTSAESTFFDNDASEIIAYGEKIFTSSEDWSKFSIELEYRDLLDENNNVVESAHSRVPTHIIIVAVSSRYADYYTGSKNSNMWVDDFELVYTPQSE